jgi:hypothetical protein
MLGQQAHRSGPTRRGVGSTDQQPASRAPAIHHTHWRDLELDLISAAADHVESGGRGIPLITAIAMLRQGFNTGSWR